MPLIDLNKEGERRPVLYKGKWIDQIGDGPYCSLIRDEKGELVRWCRKSPMSHDPAYKELIKPPEFVPFEEQSVEEKNKIFLEQMLARGYWTPCENEYFVDPISAATKEMAKVGAVASMIKSAAHIAIAFVGPVGVPFKFFLDTVIGVIAGFIGERQAAQHLARALEDAQNVGIRCTLWRMEKDPRTGERKHYGVDGPLAGFCYDPDRTLRQKFHLGPGAYAELRVFAPCVTKWELVPVEGRRGVFIKKPVY